MIGDLVFELVQIPGPTGFESRVANRLKELLESHVDEIHIDKIGNLIARKKGTEGKRSLAMVAHMDQVSMVVLKVDEFVWFDKLGWIDLRNLPGTPVLILGEERDVPGVVCSTSAHFAAADMPLWIDIGDRQKYVSAGDPIIFNYPPRWLDDNKTLLASHSIDDRVCCSILVEIAKRLPKETRHDIYLIGSVQEEIGCFGVRYLLKQMTPDWFITLDTGFAQDAIPDINKTTPLRTGLVLRRLSFAQPADRIYPASVSFASPLLNKRLMTAAGKQNVSLNIDVSTRTFSDHNAAYEINPAMASTTFMVARRYSHSPNEVVDLTNAERAVDILCQVITDSDNWEE